MYGIVRTTVRQAACRRVPIGCLVTIWALVGILLLPSTARAQAVTGTLLGNVTDSSGAAVPGATVTATEVQTNIEPDRSHQRSGQLHLLQPAERHLHRGRRAPGLQEGGTAEREGRRQHDRPRRHEARSRPDQRDGDRVARRRPLLQTDRTDTGRIIESKMVSELPLTFNRNFQSAARSRCRASTRPHREHSQFFNSQDSLRFEVNGQPRHGEQHADRGARRQPEDRAAAGHHPGGRRARDRQRLDQQLRRGVRPFGRRGHERHAQVRHQRPQGQRVLLRQQRKDQRRRLLHATSRRRRSSSTAASRSAGRSCKSKLFFFGDYQRTIDNNGYVVRDDGADGGDAERRLQRGRRRESTIRSTGDVTGANRTAFANNRSRQNRISPIAQKLLGFIPLPNIAGAALGQNNYQKAQVREKTTDGFDTQVQLHAEREGSDVLPPQLHAAGGLRSRACSASTAARPTAASPAPARTPATAAPATWTRVFSADDRARRARRPELLPQRHGDAGQRADDQHGRRHSRRQPRRVHQRPFADQHRRLLAIRCSGSRPASRGIGRRRRGTSTATLTQADAATTRSSSAASGATTATCCCRRRTPAVRAASSTSTPRAPALPSESATLSGVANSFASFLLDWPNTVQRDLKVIDEPGTKHWASFAFIQDKWQARPNVTVDLGLRWEYYTPLVGPRGQGQPRRTTIRRPTRCASPGYGDTDERAEREEQLQALRAAHRRLLAPQREDVVRAGYGASTIPFPDNRYAFNYPVKQNYNGLGRQRLPARRARWRPDSRRRRCSAIPSNGDHPGRRGVAAERDVRRHPDDLHEGTLHSWNVAFQRQLPYLLTADVAYVGNRGVDLVMDVDTNAEHGLRLGQQRPAAVRAVQPHRHDRARAPTWNKSQYNGLQMKIDRRFRNGFLVTNSYTLSRSMDYVNENTTASARRSTSSRAGRDRTSIACTTTRSTGLYELPWGPNKRWLNEGLLGKIIGGWQLSGIFVAQSGTPLNITGNGTLLNTPGNTALRRTSIGEQHGARRPRARASCTSIRRSTRCRRRRRRAT